MLEVMIEVDREAQANELARLQADISRLNAAQRLMRSANHAVRQGDVRTLQHLGFSKAYIEVLKARAASGRDAFPRGSLQNNELDLQQLHCRANELIKQSEQKKVLPE